jgi:hypothetical protein
MSGFDPVGYAHTCLPAKPLDGATHYKTTFSILAHDHLER